MELWFLFSACPLIILYICIKFYENILDGNKLVEQTRFSLEIFQRGIISQKLYVELHSLMFIFVPSCMKISLAVFKL